MSMALTATAGLLEAVLVQDRNGNTLQSTHCRHLLRNSHHLASKSNHTRILNLVATVCHHQRCTRHHHRKRGNYFGSHRTSHRSHDYCNLTNDMNLNLNLTGTESAEARGRSGNILQSTHCRHLRHNSHHLASTSNHNRTPNLVAMAELAAKEAHHCFW